MPCLIFIHVFDFSSYRLLKTKNRFTHSGYLEFAFMYSLSRLDLPRFTLIYRDFVFICLGLYLFYLDQISALCIMLIINC